MITGGGARSRAPAPQRGAVYRSPRRLYDSRCSRSSIFQSSSPSNVVLRGQRHGGARGPEPLRASAVPHGDALLRNLRAFPNHGEPAHEDNRRDIIGASSRTARLGSPGTATRIAAFFIDGTGEFIAATSSRRCWPEAFLLRHPERRSSRCPRHFAVKDMVANTAVRR